ncbi:Beta/Gamma crystallin [Micromonospora rhizosphaerae]|uniref:Beta/Gamma crystallin n=1 Tax=Micromonospora rhizosphaerae TaxID=568872 RepID=A0A1C6S0N5_9ACTN|nr:hypothetical protein [Micromonospora rhizosphaerae]SCL22955.1 Beta/Gamma crystallin [Micromonospora rhizosphaerae]
MAKKRDDLMGLISAVASGDVSREDVVADLKKQKVDALDVLIEVFARQARASSSRKRGERIDVQTFSARPSTAPPKPVHRVPRLPVLLRGTLYDPQDITRFDGTELHFVATGRDHILAIDDRAVMENWWQTSYLSSMASSNNTIMKETTDPTIPTVTTTNTGRPGGFGTDLGPTNFTPPPTPVPTPVVVGPCVLVPLPAPIEHTNFYEHPDFVGERLELEAGQGAISNLKNEHFGGIFSGDDWNDKISSVEMVRTEVTVLYEHVGFVGNSITITGGGERQLWRVHNEAWNDRASSVRTWGSTPWTKMGWYCGPWG